MTRIQWVPRGPGFMKFERTYLVSEEDNGGEEEEMVNSDSGPT